MNELEGGGRTYELTIKLEEGDVYIYEQMNKLEGGGRTY